MTVEDLNNNLIILGIHPRNYTLNGPPYNDSSWVIELKGKVWSVFNFERGKRYDERFFNSEDEACKYIFEKLKKWQELVIKFKLKG